jgi:hypothetical protein
MKRVLVDNVHHYTSTCPYLVERFALLAVHFCSQLMRSDSPTEDKSLVRSVQIQSDNESGSTQFHTSKNTGIRLIHSVDKIDYWSLMRMLRSMPAQYLTVIADRLGCALLTFIRVSPGAACVTHLEDWYLLFSLLTSATAGSSGRPYVWAVMQYLVNSNLITDKNFNPARQLLMRFLFG